ncbi:hypothetical protein BV25DRAFT_1839799 [Artomyces pyxidatus]|uniref:Uncharacterized protein n=1 Tax=Artomyces pyxidatus TaxID=48021 RepID=A0ACB8SVQ5_9AGAM|nr:hypothetical protein BV25DRAFT_1839799 [Artomyces pyxidatus]
MTLSDMKTLSNYMESAHAIVRYSKKQIILFKAVAAILYHIYARVSTCGRGEQAAVTLELSERKSNLLFPTWPYIAAPSFSIPSQPEPPELDAFRRVQDWFKILEEEIGRPVRSSDYVFPRMNNSGQLKMEEHMSSWRMEGLFDDIFKASGVLLAHAAKPSFRVKRTEEPRAASLMRTTMLVVAEGNRRTLDDNSPSSSAETPRSATPQASADIPTSEATSKKRHYLNSGY